MKWGPKHVNGCKESPGPKAHPVMCIKSLDLKCLDRNCPAKLHTSKCSRWKAPAGGYRARDSSASGPWGWGQQPPGGGGPGPARMLNPWLQNGPPRSSASTGPPMTQNRAGGSENEHQNSSFQKMTVQQMLEAQQVMFRDMMNKFHQQMQQELHQQQAGYLAPGGGPPRPFFFQT